MADIMKLAQNAKDRERVLIEQARKRIPEEFHDFLIPIEQNEKLMGIKTIVSEELRSMGVWSGERGTFIKTTRPYMAVDGRVAMMVANHNKKEVNYSLITEPEMIGDNVYIKTIFEGLSVNGTPCRTIARAKIGYSDSGVDATNPVENAETSSVGRALGFAGYGLIGTGIASAEEVQQTMKEEETDNPSATQQNKINWTAFWMKIRELGLDKDKVHAFAGVKSLTEIISNQQDLDEFLTALQEATVKTAAGTSS